MRDLKFARRLKTRSSIPKANLLAGQLNMASQSNKLSSRSHNQVRLRRRISSNLRHENIRGILHTIMINKDHSSRRVNITMYTFAVRHNDRIRLLLHGMLLSMVILSQKLANISRISLHEGGVRHNGLVVLHRGHDRTRTGMANADGNGLR